jgi:hypothetical protein
LSIDGRVIVITSRKRGSKRSFGAYCCAHNTYLERIVAAAARDVKSHQFSFKYNLEPG